MSTEINTKDDDESNNIPNSNVSGDEINAQGLKTKKSSISTEMDEYFAEIGDNIVIDKDKKLITNSYNSWIGDSWNSSYGVNEICGTDQNKIYEAEFKIIKKNTSTSAINIGIECNKWKNINSNFSDQYSNDDGVYFAYSSNGKKYSHQDGFKYGQSFGDSYTDGDIIWMRLQFIVGLDYGWLYFKKNDGNWLDTHFKIKKQEKIRIAVSLRSASYFEGGQSSLELISFSSFNKEENINNDDIDDIDDEKKDDKITNDTEQIGNKSQSESMDNNKQIENELSEQSEIVRLKMQISSINDRLNEKQKQCVLLEKTNTLLRDERDEIQNKLKEKHEAYIEQQEMIKNLSQQIEEYKKNLNNLSNSDEKKSDDNGDELERDKQIKDDLKYLEQELNEFHNKYNKNELVEIYNNSPDALIINNEINALDLRLRSFGKYLIDTKAYIEEIIYPDINKYEQWNINQIMQWISLLEEGRYKKYLNVLRDGFKSDDIKGINLPDLDKNVLRTQPFNISCFPDRKDLEIHFKSLCKASKQTENEEIVYNAENTEGSLTEYHI